MTNQIEIQISPYIGHNVKKKLKHQSSIAKNLIQRFLFKTQNFEEEKPPKTLFQRRK